MKKETTQGTTMYEMLRSAKLYEAKDHSGPCSEKETKYFFNGFDAGFSSRDMEVEILTKAFKSLVKGIQDNEF